MKNRIALSIVCSLIMLSPIAVPAQTSPGCAESELTDPPRILYQCAGGVVLEAEAAAALGIVETGPEDRPSDVNVNSNALLIKVAPGSGPFQIRTPHAIAAVRGTEYVVDVTGETTAVFVRSGEVAVSRIDGSGTVVLTEGLGADVTPGEPLTARRWPAERAASLLSRFGR